MIAEDEIWRVIDVSTEPAKGYKDALEMLSPLPSGYRLYFAYHYVNADICNGGFSQLNKNSTWFLILTAIDACQVVGAEKIERLLREAVLYFDQKGRSRLKKTLTEDFFSGINRPMKKPLAEIEDEYFSLERERNAVVSALLEKPALWKNS